MSKIGTHYLGETVKSKLGSLIITKNIPKPGTTLASTVTVKLTKIESAVNTYQNRLNVEPVNKLSSSVLTLSIVDPIKEIGVDFLNTLIKKYNEDAVKDKNQVAAKTEIFINARLKNIARELDSVESGMVSFKTTNKLMDITSEANVFLQTASDYQKNIAAIATQIEVVESMVDYISKSTIADIIPTNVIPEQSDAVGLIATYNDLVTRTAKVRQSATDLNSTVLNNQRQLTDLRSSIIKSLSTLKSSLLIKQKEIEGQGRIVNGKISAVPGQEKEFTGIVRNRDIKQTIYLYLLQKREENAITLAVTARIRR
ncbi:hypothetical protein [Flavobacterium sp. 3HN19-14]|uniref:hypothetical protein n=1 Tax=Flavobacterium sp. 3HN19-14 TaxID=3448133 RepID=UPI003EE2386B